MTRINTIPPSLLMDQHLMAEYRELPMVNASLARTIRSKRGLRMENIPSQYTLNSGHVTFHYDKGLYLFNRFQLIVDELAKRGYNISPENRIIDWSVFKLQPNLWNDWQPNSQDHAVNVQRIVERIGQKIMWYRFNGSTVDEAQVERFYSGYLNPARGL